MNRELNWTETATKILEESNEVWMSVPNIIKTVQRTGIKHFDYSYGRACRTMRATMKHHSRKENGMFARCERDNRVLYCLRKRLRSRGNPPKPLPTKSPPPPTLANGTLPSPESRLPVPLPSPPPTLSLTPPTITIEIDPAHCRPSRTPRPDGGVGRFCLPSPLHSILGPKRTLRVFNESVGLVLQRPVRKVRQKRNSSSKSDAEDSKPPPPPVLSNGPTPPEPPLPSLPEVCGLEEACLVPSLLSEVAFVKTEGDEEPSTVQGERVSSESLEIDPWYTPPSDSITSDSEDSMSTQSESDYEQPPILLQPRPTSQLLVRKSLLAQLISGIPADPAYLPTTRQTEGMSTGAGFTSESRRGSEPMKPPSSRPEQSVLNCSSHHRSYSVDAGFVRPLVRRPEPVTARQISSLFTPTSPLINEHLRPFLNVPMFEGLPANQQRNLISLLPSVDQREGNRVAEGSFSNEFFSSAVREWQERLAVGAFTTEYRARARQDEKRRTSISRTTDDSWKQNYYEDYWGERVESKPNSSAPLYYPVTESSLPPTHMLCLQAIKKAYNKTASLPISPLDKKPVEPALPPKLPSPPVTKNHVVVHPKVIRKNHKPVVKLNTTMKSLIRPPMRKAPVKRLTNTPLHRSRDTLLSPLPAKTSYQSLLWALAQASKLPHAKSETVPPYSPPPSHNHAVFHDHFSLLSARHVPEEFCGPVKTLVISLPKQHYITCLQQKAANTEHDYGVAHKPSSSSLRISLPRALLPAVCVCNGEALIYCPACHSLYHVTCNRVCPCCSA